MAAIPRMLSAAREEATILTSELATAARTTATEGLAAEARIASESMNPVALRQAVEMSVKESSEGKHTCELCVVSIEWFMNNSRFFTVPSPFPHYNP